MRARSPPHLGAAESRLVLVTGAGGNIGRYFAEHSRKRYRLRLMLRTADECPQLEQLGEIVAGDLTNLGEMKQLCRDVDTVLHNRFKRLDISDVRELLGYDPQDDFAEENPALAGTGVADEIRAHRSQESGIRKEVDEK